MSETETIEVDRRSTAALDYARSNRNEHIHPHFLWRLEKIAEAVTRYDFTTAELRSLAAVLIPTHTRLLAGRPGPAKRRPADHGFGILDQESTERAYLRK